METGHAAPMGLFRLPVVHYKLAAPNGAAFRSPSAAIDAARQAGFGHRDFAQLRETRFQAVPNPGRDIFAGRVFEAGNVVKIIMIKLIEDGLESLRDIRVIHQPAERRIAVPGQCHLHFEAMPVESAAFMRLGQERQQMSRLELKRFPQFNFHKIISPWSVVRSQ